MKTVNLSALHRDKYTSSDFNPLIAVDDAHLLVKQQPQYHGVFQAQAGKLPSTLAKSFRMTNSGSENINVQQKVLVFSRYFDTDSFGLTPDSPTMQLEGVNEVTPVGESQVLELTYSADTAAYTSVPVIPGASNLIYQVWFKIENIESEIQPLGIYSERSSIDINYPAAGIRIKPDLSIAVRVGYTEFVPADQLSVQVGRWYRATIEQKPLNTFEVQIEMTDGINFTSLISSDELYTSNGVGLLSEIADSASYVIGFAAEGVATQKVEAFEVYQAVSDVETLIAGTTKEYFCNRSLDEYTVSDQVSGYYRS